MSKTCPACSNRFTPTTFRLWSGRCPECDHAMTWTAKNELQTNRARPPVTMDEFSEFLKYADDLAVIRLRKFEASQLAGVVIPGGALWLGGMGFHQIDFQFGIFFAVFVGSVFSLIYWPKLRSICPRCHKLFSRQTSIAVSVSRLRLRIAPSSEQCECCGLRALSSFDIQRFLKTHGEAFPHIDSQQHDTRREFRNGNSEEQ